MKLFAITYPSSGPWYPKKYYETNVKEGSGFRWAVDSFHKGIPKGSFLRPIKQDKDLTPVKKRQKNKKIREFEILGPDGRTITTSNWRSTRDPHIGKTFHESTHFLNWNEVGRYVRPATEQEIENLKDCFLDEAIQELW